MFVEFIGGYICGSLALTADAGHMLIDSVGLLLSWLAFRFGKKTASPEKTFGYSRLEIIASLVNSIFLFGLSIVIIIEAIGRLLKPIEVMTVPMLLISVLGLIVNCMVFYMLNRGETDHLNIRAALLHVLGDLLGSVAAIAAAVVIYFTSWSPIDSILSVFVCLLILNSVWKLFRDSFNILMEGTPPSIDIKEVRAYFIKFPNVKDVQDIHIWSITSNKHAAMLNILVKDETKTKETVRSVKKKLAENFGVCYSSVEISDSQK
jgi:cobalt-zinc-cadmium efflux system protein